MRLFKDGRGLLRRVRWVRVIAVTAAIGAGVTWGRRTDEEAAAISALKVITTSSLMWREADHDTGPLDYGSLETLSNTTLIDSVDAGPAKQGYVFDTGSCMIPATLGLPVGK